MASSTKTAQCASGKSRKHQGQSAPPVQQSMMQSPTTVRKAPSDAKSSYGGGGGKENNADGKESAPSSDVSLRTAKRKRKGKVEIRKQKKKGFGLFSKDDHSGNISQEASIQTPSAQLSAAATDAPESRASLKMIDTIPNDGTKIVMKRFIQMTCAKGIQGILQEFDDIKATSYMPGQIKKDTFNKHPDKNRYKDTFCLEDTRVILKWPEGNSMDYIHANWVQNLPEMSKDIICTQGPTEKTLDDFWRMIWQEKCICIIMLCGIMESGKKKYEQVCCFDFGDTVDYYFKLYIFMQIH